MAKLKSNSFLGANTITLQSSSNVFSATSFLPSVTNYANSTDGFSIFKHANGHVQFGWIRDVAP